MKKILKSFLLIAIISIMLLGCTSYATGEMINALDPNITSEDVLLDGALDAISTNPNADEGIMPISADDGTMPINDDSALYIDAVESDVFVCEDQVSYTENVNGNVYIIGKDVEISSLWINGNVFVIAENVTVRGNINGSLYVIGENINIDTEAIYTVYALGKNVTVDPVANIFNDLKVAAKELNIEGNVYRELDAGTEKIFVNENSQVISKGNVYYSEECNDNGNLLSGINVVKTEKRDEVANEVKNALTVATVKSQIINIISIIVVIAVIYLLIKNKNIENSELSSSLVLKNIGIGFISLIIVPIICIILLCTLIGIPLSVILILLYILALYISIPVASLSISNWVYNQLKSSNKWLMIVYAICVYIVIELISLIPVIGSIVRFLIVLFGFGTLIKFIFPSKNKEVTPKEEEVVKE